MVIYRPTISMDGKILREISRNQQNGSTKSNGACLTMLQLQTFLTETEAISNSRTLVYLGEDLNDRTALTPSHFQS